jgi:hypothetical protein
MIMDKKTVIINVKGEKHVFRLPGNVAIKDVLDKYAQQLGLSQNDVNNVEATIQLSISQPIDEMNLQDNFEISINIPNADAIEYKGKKD